MIIKVHKPCPVRTCTLISTFIVLIGDFVVCIIEGLRYYERIQYQVLMIKGKYTILFSREYIS